MLARRQQWTWPVIALLAAAVLAAGAAGSGSDGDESNESEDAPAKAGAAEGPGEDGGPPPARVRVAPVLVEQLQARSNVVGRLQAVKQSIVAAQRAGRVVEVAVEEGDRVIGGQTTLVQVDDELENLEQAVAEAQLVEARAMVDEADALLQLRQRHYEYLASLRKTNSVGKKEFDDAADARIAAKAALDRSEAQVRTMERRVELWAKRIERLRTVAPFDGVVVSKMTEVGQWVDEGTEVMQVISTGPIDAVIDVSERLINQIRSGDVVPVIIEPLDQTTEGRVVSITPRGSNAARTFPVKIRFDDDREGGLKAGMSALAQVPTGQTEELMTVPRDAVHRTPTGTIVWADVGGMALPVGVRILFGSGDRYAVAPGPGGAGPPLNPQLRVVIDGAERLFPSQPLMILPDASESAARR